MAYKMRSESDVNGMVFNGLLNILNNAPGEWTGTMTDLRKSLSKQVDDKSLLPKSPSALRLVLNRIVNRVRNRGVSVKFGRSQTRYVSFVY